MKHFIVLLLLILASCNGIDDARKVHVGMSVEELEEAMGEPRYTEINNGFDELHYRYFDGMIENHMVIRVSDGEVTSFYTW